MSEEKLAYAILLRKNGLMEQSRNILNHLIECDIEKGRALLNIAWSYDNEGIEHKALKYYKLSLNEYLSKPDYFDALFGLACTLRCLGQLIEADEIFKKLIKDFPCATEVKPFYALCLSEMGRDKEALQLLFNLILENPPTPSINSYHKTLSEYILLREDAFVSNKKPLP